MDAVGEVARGESGSSSRIFRCRSRSFTSHGGAVEGGGASVAAGEDADADFVGAGV